MSRIKARLSNTLPVGIRCEFRQQTMVGQSDRSVQPNDRDWVRIAWIEVKRAKSVKRRCSGICRAGYSGMVMVLCANLCGENSLIKNVPMNRHPALRSFGFQANAIQEPVARVPGHGVLVVACISRCSGNLDSKGGAGNSGVHHEWLAHFMHWIVMETRDRYIA